MDPSSLESELVALRAAISRLSSDVEGVAEAERQLSEKLRGLGLDESNTTVDLPTIAGLPSRRRSRSSSPSSASAAPASPLKPAAVGAGLMLGVAIVVLLAMNLQSARNASTPAPAPAPAPGTSTVVAMACAPAPDPPPVPAPPSESAAEPPKPEMGSLSITCSPKCDAITDNGAPLSPGGTVVAVPVPAGVHKLVFANGSQRRSQSVVVTPNQTKELKVGFDPLPTDRSDRGF